MYQQDYILRLIETAGAAFRRMISLIVNGQPLEALELSDEAIKTIAETESTLIDALTANSVLAVLGAGGTLDAPRVALLGLALAHRADALEAIGRITEAGRQREKSEVLLTAAREADPGIDVMLEGLVSS
ncbi:MAG: hypothetical protein U1E29_13495, partial [Coriobacteriia bacterium]|nr:hypothetical protein [Coriobacteriia bacterium]